MARSEMRDGARGKVAPPVAEPAHDLDSAERQFEILNPKTLRYDLVLEREYIDEKVVGGKKVREPVREHVKRTIIVPTEFTLGDILTRRVKDDMESFTRLTIVELSQLLPSNVSVADVFSTSPGYLEAALLKANVRESLRGLVASVSTFEDEPALHPTANEIADGMDYADLQIVGGLFFNRALEEMVRRKNARTAAGA